MFENLGFFLNRIRERLWVKPLLVCIMSIVGALLAHMADDTGLGEHVPDITRESAEDLLKIIAASMLVIATFAVASMVSAYASTGSTATPRAFPLIIADDVSQNALSTFIGAFIFSIVALTALMNGYYGRAGRFTIFALALTVLALVIVTFMRWVDRIARLGRLGSIIDKVEDATEEALCKRRSAPALRGIAATGRTSGRAVYAADIGYVQRIDMTALQKCAEAARLRVTVDALPGTFAAPGRPIARVRPDSGEVSEEHLQRIAQTFVIGDNRTFDDDPRFGLVALSEIAGRALSPAVNDPGTAIDIIGTFVRLFALWADPVDEADMQPAKFDRVEVPPLDIRDMFDDAFTAIARDGASAIEVVVRLQKALASLAAIGDPAMTAAALHHARLALARAEQALQLPEDKDVARRVAAETLRG